MNPVFTIILVRTFQFSVLALVLHWFLRWPLTGPHALGLFLTPLLCAYFVFVFVAPWSWGLPIVTRLKTSEKLIALTFDDGPSLETTPRILETLARHSVPATFFVLGENVRRHPEIFRRIVSEGHGIGIHGDTHTPFVLYSAARVGEEIARTRAALQAACPSSETTTWLRPPYGFKESWLPACAHRAGCRLVTWGVNARDYRRQNPEAIANAVLSHIGPGAIVLLHDGAANAPTADALSQILDGLHAQGYRCALLNEL
jgi:peptidoglycan/xylan/chitin deacetylase (PgdA/CDA1 family)